MINDLKNFGLYNSMENNKKPLSLGEKRKYFTCVTIFEYFDTFSTFFITRNDDFQIQKDQVDVWNQEYYNPVNVATVDKNFYLLR